MQCIGVATSAAPAGPFTPREGGPLVCQTGEGGSIDPSTFVDEDGTAYLLWKNDGNSCGRPCWIYLQRLASDGLALEGPRARLITPDRPWEGAVVEGPVLWKHAGRYYLFYAANDFATPRYAIGYAVAPSLAGPYRKPDAPLLATDARLGLLGPGGPHLVAGPDGETWMLFHAWAAGRYRALWTARVAWQDGPVIRGLGRTAAPWSRV